MTVIEGVNPKKRRRVKGAMLFKMPMSAGVQSLGMWDNVGVPRSKWGTQQEPGAEWYNNATATK